MDFKIGDRVKISESVLNNIYIRGNISTEDLEKEYIIITGGNPPHTFRIKDFTRSGNEYFVSGNYLIKIEEVNNKEKEFNNNDLCGRRFKILYKSYGEMLGKMSLLECKPKYIEGMVENFNPMKEVVINDERFGFNIIPYQSIIYMEQIRKEV